MQLDELKPMRDAPRDGTEILAYSAEGKNFHPVKWLPHRNHWGCRWITGYCQHDGDFLGWIEYPTISDPIKVV